MPTGSTTPETGEAIRQPGRRDAGYWYKTDNAQEAEQLQIFREEEWDDLPFVNSTTRRCQEMERIELPKTLPM